VVGAAAVAALVLAFYVGFWAQTPDYATLYTGLSEEDAAAVVDHLKTLGIPYRLLQGGSVIQVPSREVYNARLEMAKQGLPKGSTVGFELFDGGQLGNLGMTDFMQRVNYQRALEGELARTITSMEPVASARVHIVIPEPSLFISEQRSPTASIVLQLKPNAELTRAQVRAVTHLVASSVEGLKPGNITLVDMTGNILSAAGEADSVPSTLQASTGQLEVQRTYERELEARLQTMLDQTIGPDRAVVRVSAAFNWDQKQVNSETYAPLTDGVGVVRSETSREETYEGSGTPAGGVPGVDSNTTPPTYPTTGTTGPSKYERQDTTKNYEVSKVIQAVVTAPGTLQRLSVAVLMSDVIPQAQADNIQTMLVAAAGVDTSRGDSVVVQRVPFEDISAAAEPSVAEAERRSLMISLMRLVALLLALVILLRFARLTFRDLARRLGQEQVPYVAIVDEELSAPMPAQQLPEPAAAAAVRQAESAAPEIEMLPEPPPNPLRDRLIAVAEEDPELIAELVQSWLAEK
ncbi:MAG: flagellar M-ring protein FliF, partial [Anaerolineae bacterium]|nr:flagellar M-ring protein FliF [Anaerolineae bacterium]